MSSSARDVLPQRIRLSIIDRYHVVPETADRRGPHFPIAGLAAFRLKESRLPFLSPRSGP
jgi:hypothetical protein